VSDTDSQNSVQLINNKILKNTAYHNTSLNSLQPLIALVGWGH